MAATPTAIGEISIEMSPAVSEPASATRRSRSRGRGGDDVALPDIEKKPNILLRCAAFLEWAGNACGALSFLWATVVMLRGFCTLLQPSDFWSTTVIIFIEAFRLFTRDNHLDNHPLFGTTGAIKQLTSHSVLKDEKQQFYSVLAVVSLCDRIIYLCPKRVKGIALIVMAASGVLIGNLPFSAHTHLRRHLWLFLSSLLITLFGFSAHWVCKFWIVGKSFQAPPLAVVLVHTVVLLIMALVQTISVLILIVKPPRVKQFISKPHWIKVLYLVKVVLSLGLIVEVLSLFMPAHNWFIYDNLVKTILTLVLALSTIQVPNNETAYYWMDVSLSICMSIAWLFWFETAVLNPGVLLVILICGNLQLPTSIARMLLSLLRLQHQQLVKSYPKPGSTNLLPTLHVFYWLVMCQGIVYLCACIISFFGTRLQLHNEKGLGDVQKEEATFSPQTIPDGSIAISIRSTEEQSNTNPVNWILVGTIPVPI